VAPRVTTDVEATGIAKTRGITVGIGQSHKHQFPAARHHRAADIDRPGGETVRRRLHRPVVAQHLLDRVLQQ
jgi:hypothetical protein